MASSSKKHPQNKSDSPARPGHNKSAPPKVGSSEQAARNFAGNDDFGIPINPDEQGNPPVEQRHDRGLADTGEEAGAREKGVGTRGERGTAGHGSGGDASADFTLGSTVGSSGKLDPTAGPDSVPPTGGQSRASNQKPPRKP